MNILRIFSVVVGIHVCALVLIFANPGCSSPNRTAPSPTENVSQNNGSPVSRADTDNVSPVVIAGSDSPGGAVPSSFDPAASATPDIRFSPTRPGTPTATALESQPVGDVLPASTYTVVKGDSLWTIAKKHQISVTEIAAANNIRPNATIRLGQKLIIPSKSSSSVSSGVEPVITSASAPRPAPVAKAASASSVKHVVRPGETLGAIARKYQVKVGEIATANNISDPAKIRQGMELVIPGWQAPKGQTNTPTASTPAESSSPIAQPETTEPASPLIVPAPETDPTGQPPVIRVE